MALNENELKVLGILAEKQDMTASEIADEAEIKGFIGRLVGRRNFFIACAHLQMNGLIEARWNDNTENPRSFFRINDAGRDALSQIT